MTRRETVLWLCAAAAIALGGVVASCLSDASAYDLGQPTGDITDTGGGDFMRDGSTPMTGDLDLGGNVLKGDGATGGKLSSTVDAKWLLTDNAGTSGCTLQASAADECTVQDIAGSADGTLKAGAATFSGAATLSGTLDVTGAASFDAAIAHDDAILASDTATTDSYLYAESAYPEATGGNVTGANLVLSGGDAVQYFTVTDYTVGSGDTQSIRYHVLNTGMQSSVTEGVDYNCVTDNNTCATNLASAIDAIANLDATATGANVYVSGTENTRTKVIQLYDADGAADGTSTSHTEESDGTVVVPDKLKLGPSNALSGVYGRLIYDADEDTYTTSGGTDDRYYVYVSGAYKIYVNATTIFLSNAGGVDITAGPVILKNDEKIDNDSNGKIGFTGVGGTNNENLSFDVETTSNKVTLGTSTGVTTFDLGSLNLEVNNFTYHKDVTASQAGVGATAPTFSTFATTHRCAQFDGAGATQFLEMEIPDQYVSGTNITLAIYAYAVSGDAIADGEVVDFDVSYRVLQETDAYDSVPLTAVNATYTQSGAGTDKGGVEIEGTLLAADPNNPLAAGEIVYAVVDMDEVATTYSSDVHVCRYEFDITVNGIPNH